MNEDQEKKFKEWAHKEDFFKKFDGFSPTLTDLVMTAKKTWQACLDANKVAEQEPEPTPTEMVRRLLENGWTIHKSIDTFYFKHETMVLPSNFNLEEAYRKAFPHKKKIEVEVWLQQCPDNKHKVRETGYFGIAGHDLWIKGTATFWVEDSDET